MTQAERERILLAMDACSVLSAGLADTLASVAARLGAELEGLFVEDAELMRAAELPFVSEVVASGIERGLTAESLQRLNRDMSRELDRLLSRAAGERKVRWRCSTVQGSRLMTAFAAAEQCDLFVPGRAGHRRGAPDAAASPFTRIGLVIQDPVRAARALSVIHALAGNGHTREVLLVCDRRPPADLLSALAADRIRTYVQTSTMTDARALLEQVRPHAPGLLIAPKTLLPPSTVPAVYRLLDALPMSVLLLR